MGYCYEKYTGQEEEVILPAEVNGQFLTAVGTKAFLSCKSVKRLVLPCTVEEIGTWAFAHMKNLEEIVLPDREIRFGRKVFLGCDRLRRVRLRHCPRGHQCSAGKGQQCIVAGIGYVPIYSGMEYLLATAFTVLEEEKLQNPELLCTAEGRRQWLIFYDEALAEYLARSDEEGFEPAFIGWFDIEDVDDQRQNYVLQERRKKIELAFQRLLYAEGISGELQEFLGEYLGGKMDEPTDGQAGLLAGRQSALRTVTGIPELVMELFCDENFPYGQDIRYYQLWRQAGGLDCETAKVLMERQEKMSPEIRGYLLELQLEEQRGGDFYAGLEL